MRFLFLSLLCIFVSSTYGCEAMSSGNPQVDQLLFDTNALGEPGMPEGDLSFMIKKLLAEGLRQLFSGGNINFEDFNQKTAEILSHPEYVSLLEKASMSVNLGECGSCGGIESDSCGDSIGLDTTCSDLGDSCAALNKVEL